MIMLFIASSFASLFCCLFNAFNSPFKVSVIFAETENSRKDVVFEMVNFLRSIDLFEGCLETFRL